METQPLIKEGRPAEMSNVSSFVSELVFFYFTRQQLFSPCSLHVAPPAAASLDLLLRPLIASLLLLYFLSYDGAFRPYRKSKINNHILVLT